MSGNQHFLIDFQVEEHLLLIKLKESQEIESIPRESGLIRDLILLIREDLLVRMRIFLMKKLKNKL